MGLSRQDLNISEYLKVDEMWHGIDRTEGGLGLKIPVRTEFVMQKTMLEAQLILNLADDLIRYCRRAHRGERRVKDAENLEVDLICADNPMTAGVKIVDAGAAIKDPYFIRIYLNKTFGMNQINIAWGMCSDELLLPHYMNDLRQRLGNGRVGTGPMPPNQASMGALAARTESDGPQDPHLWVEDVRL